MLNSIKAISLGLMVIFILGLVFQLLIILSAVAYNFLVHSFPVFGPWSQWFNYIISGISFFIVMASAGFITATASKQYFYINTTITALLGMSLSLYLSLQQEVFTLFAIIFVAIGLIFSLYGCYKVIQQPNKKTTAVDY